MWPAAGVIGAILHVLLSRRKRTATRVLEVFLLWWMAWGVGVTAFAAFFANAFASDAVAKQIGFPIGNPFQFEVAMANLAVMFLGFICLKYRGLFWTATTIAATVYLWGAAYGHINQAVNYGNNHAYNTGPILYTDIGVQVVLIVALIIYRRMLGANILTGAGGRLGVDVGSTKRRE